MPAVLFFALGFLAKIIKSDLRFPSDLAKALSIYLPVAIGLHGGYELGKAHLLTAMISVMWALFLGFGIPLISCAILVPGSLRFGPAANRAALLALLFPPAEIDQPPGRQIAGPDQSARRQAPSSCTTSYLAQRAKSARVQVPVVRAWAPAMTR